MKIKVGKKEFVKALQIGGALAGNNRALPISDCVKIKVANGEVKFTSTDGANAITKKMDGNVECDCEGIFCISAKDLLSYAKLIRDDDFCIDATDGRAVVTHSRGNMEMPVYNVNEFPILRLGEVDAVFDMRTDILRKWVLKAQSFASTDDLRMILCGMYLYKEGSEIGCCSTDSSCLYTDSYVSDADEASDFGIVINRSSFKSIIEAIDGQYAKISISKRNVMFSSNGTFILSKLAEGRYPNFRSVIPKDTPVKVNISKKELLESLTRAQIAASKASLLSKFAFQGSNLIISCSDFDLCKKSEENICIDGAADVEIGFKMSNLLMIINSIQTERVKMEMSDGTHAVIFSEMGGNEREIMLQMPMLL